jgi:hypothetical protein
MTASLDCESVRELAAEVALGGLTGPERAAAIDHLDGCGACQGYVDELAAVADRLLLLAPEDEPSVGLESRVLNRIDQLKAKSQPGRRWLVPVAAAAAVLVAAASAFAVHETDHRQVAGAEYPTVGGRSMRAAPLVDAANVRIGQAFMYNGSPSWVLVSIDHAGVDGSYTIVCTGPATAPVVWPNLRVSGGHGTLAWTVPRDVSGLQDVSVVDAAGRTAYTARLARSAA